MVTKKISEIGSQVIRSRARKVLNVRSSRTKKIIKDLVAAMREGNLVGMAAPQIGVGERLFVTEIRKTRYRRDVSQLDELRVFINPEIVSRSKKEADGYEGCGSVASAGLFGPVKRPEAIKVRALNEQGEKFEMEAKGLLARVIQHEIDHLDGIVFLDRVTDTKKLLGREEYLKRKKQR